MARRGPGRVRVLAAAAALLTGAAAMPPASQAAPPAHGPAAEAPLMTWPDLLGRPKPTLKPERLRYGADPNQVVDLWRPPAPGPHPVVLMIHGGCWQASVASLHIMDWAAADLARRGVAVWNIEYRRADQPGGGFPGTYDDVSAAADLLARTAHARGLVTGDGLVVVGHSAGGHLALWLAGRGRALHFRSPRVATGPARIRAVIDLTGLADLEHDTATACGPEVVAQMAGSPPDYPATSPAHRLPVYAELFVIHGAQDTTVPPAIGDAFAAKARAAGVRVTVSHPPGGHTEEISPGTPSWEATAALLLRLSGRHPPAPVEPHAPA